MYLINTLKQDDRFKPGVEYVVNTVLSYQRDIRTNPGISFPIDLEIDEIAVTIDERCPDYTSGEQTTAVSEIVNPYAAHGIVRMAKSTQPRKGWDKPKRETNFDIKCKACLGNGHCATNPDTVCYALAKTHLCSRFLNSADSKQIIKANTYRYKKRLQERSQKYKVDSRMASAIKKLEDDGESITDMNPIIKLARAIATQASIDDSCDSDDSSQNSVDS